MVRENKGFPCCLDCVRDHRDFCLAQRYPWGNRTGKRGGLAVAPKCAPANLSCNRSGKMTRKRQYLVADGDELVFNAPPYEPPERFEIDEGDAYLWLYCTQCRDVGGVPIAGRRIPHVRTEDQHHAVDPDELNDAAQTVEEWPHFVLRGQRPTVAHNRVRTVPWWAAEWWEDAMQGGAPVGGGVVGGVPLSEVEWLPLGTTASALDAAEVSTDSGVSDTDTGSESDVMDMDGVVVSAAAATAAVPSATEATPVARGWFTLWRHAIPPPLRAPSRLEDDWDEIPMPGAAAKATARARRVQMPPARKSYAEAARSVGK